jgi:hypothetical protein
MRGGSSETEVKELTGQAVGNRFRVEHGGYGNARGEAAARAAEFVGRHLTAIA